MSRPARSFLTFAIIAVVFWLIWSRLHFVVLINMPWWGLLVIALALFLVLDFAIAKIVRR